MTIYNWGSDAPIAKLETHELGKRSREATLYANPAAQPAQLAKLPDMFRALGLTATADTLDGHHVLRLRGFDEDRFVTEALEGNGFVSADRREYKASLKKDGPKKSLGDKIKEKSLKAAGLFYLVGDAGLMISGKLRGDMEEMKSGLAYSSSSIVLARYGEKKADRLMDGLYDKLLAEFAREGVDLPQLGHASAEELGKPGGIVERIENFLYDHPAEVNNAINAYAGMEFLRAGLNQNNVGKQLAGTFVTAGMLVGLLVPEKAAPKTVSLEEMAEKAKELPEDERVWVRPDDTRSLLRKAVDYVQESPLRTGGRLAMTNNFFQAQGALSDRRKSADALAELQTNGAPENELQAAQRQGHAWKFNMLAAGSYLIANGLLSISSKKASARTDNLDEQDPFEELYAASASILAAQPEETRYDLVNKMAFFLAEQKEIPYSAADLAERIHEKIDALAQSPWAAKVQQQQAAAEAASPTV